MPAYKSKAELNLDDVRALVRKAHEEGLRIQSHYKRLEQEYSDWEDRIIALDKLLSDAEEQFNLPREEIEKDNLLTRYLRLR